MIVVESLHFLQVALGVLHVAQTVLSDSYRVIDNLEIALTIVVLLHVDGFEYELEEKGC